MLSRYVEEHYLRQIKLLATSVRGLPWTLLKGIPHKLHSFTSGMEATRSHSLADVPFGLKLFIPHVS
jgi:hypothetical protein